MARLDNRVRGLKTGYETHQANTHRDTRSIFTKIGEQLHSRTVLAGTIMMFAAVAYTVPAIGDVMLVVSLLFMWWGLTREEDLPLKVPFQADMLDPKTPGKKGAGIFFVGNDRENSKEIWLTNDDCRQHMLVLGTTGAGKTESLLGFVANALTWSSGFLFCDGKGDVALFAKVYALARQFGREDDILVLNFMTGNQDLGKAAGNILSNTLNPFSTGSSDSLTTMVVSLMDDAGGDGAMWKGRATAMFTGVMRALVWLRDQDVVDLNVGTIRDYLNLRAIIDLGDPKKYPDMPQSIRKSVRSYMTSLPGFQEEKGYKQAQTTLDQHGYLEMQFTKILGSLADVYGHIFFTAAGEVDMYDVVLNRRILVIMLPALEKAPDEIANLGKIVVANLKGMMGATLGSSIQGSWASVVENRATNSPSPFLVLLDEVGYYTVEGMALMTAQARSLGFGMILASQDIPAMKKLNEKEAQSIIANTNTKIFMRTEEPEQTIGLAVQSGGKGYKSQVSGYTATAGEVSTSYRDDMSAGLQEVDRINPRDIRSQQPGEMIVMHQDHIIYAKSFYANPENSLDKHGLYLSTNHFIKVPKPSKSEIEADQRVPEVLEKLLDPAFAQRMAEEARAALAALPEAAARKDEIALAAMGFESYREKNSGAALAEAACASVANVVRAVGGLGDALSRNIAERTPPAGGSGSPRFFDEEIDDVQVLDRTRPERGALPNLESEVLASLDADDMPMPDDMAALDAMDFNEPEPVAPPRRGLVEPRRKTVIVPVEHGVSVGDRRIADVSAEPDGNDAVLRMLADLDYDPDTTTAQEVDANIQGDLGAAADLNFDDVAPTDTVDAVSYQSEKVREAQPVAPPAKEGFISEFLDALMEGDDPMDGDD